MLGLIGSALSGGAQAANEMATNTLQERREKALLKIRQDFQTSEREAGQEFQSSERVAGQEFTQTRDETQQGYAQDNARLQHEMSMIQERYRQQQQNNRTAMTSRTKPQWEVVTDGEGGYVQYDPVSNTTRPVPEGVDFGLTNEISPRQEMIVSDLQSQREIISKRLDGEMLDPEVQQELQRELDTVNAQIGRYLNPGSSSDLDAELDATLGGEPTQPAASNQGDGVTAPPRPGQAGESAQEENPPVESGFGGLIGNAISDQQAQAQELQTEKQNDEIEQEINQIRSLSSRAGIGPGMTQSQRNELARQAIERAEALMATGQLDDRQIERLQKAADNVVQYSDLELN